MPDGASAEIDAKIAASPVRRGETLGRLRALIREALPDVVEEIKWRKPSNPGGVVVWSPKNRKRRGPHPVHRRSL
jgi:hypothetical protein